jgi:N-acetylmuramoyl-L-alanine amidase
LRGTAAYSATIALLLLAVMLQAQAPPTTPLTLVSREGRRPVPTSVVDGRELVALDDVASLFQVAVKEDTVAGGVALTYRGRTIVVTANQAIASVDGRIVALPSPVIRSGRRWLVPVEFLQIALAPIYDSRIQVRRASRLVILGDMRIPQVSVRVTPGTPTRVTVDISPPAPVTATQDGTRLLIRVEADALDLALPGGNVGGLVQQIRPGEQPNTLVVTLDAAAGPARITTTPTAAATRMGIDIPAAASAAPGPPEPVAALPADPAAPPVERDALLAPRPVLQTVVIDPGHGGSDAGVAGGAGLTEKELTANVALRLRGLLETRLGIRVLLTRNDDGEVGLDRRAAVANNAKADLFLSLHANASPAATVTGAEVYYLQLDREGEQVRQEAEAAAVALPVVGGGTRTLEILRWDMAQARHVDTSATLAAIVAESLAAHVTMGATPIRRAPLRVLEGVNMPAVLVEMAYLTNRSQERVARSEDYRNQVAQALYDAVARFRRHLEERASP